MSLFLSGVTLQCLFTILLELIAHGRLYPAECCAVYCFLCVVGAVLRHRVAAADAVPSCVRVHPAHAARHCRALALLQIRHVLIQLRTGTGTEAVQYISPSPFARCCWHLFFAFIHPVSFGGCCYFWFLLLVVTVDDDAAVATALRVYMLLFMPCCRCTRSWTFSLLLCGAIFEPLSRHC